MQAMVGGLYQYLIASANDAVRINAIPTLHGAFAGDGTSGIFVWGAHLYRSDLGGMVNNPAQSTGFETYVPTASSAVYLPRVGHHIYNGNAWVNEGVLHESEARTNLLTLKTSLIGVKLFNAPWGQKLLLANVPIKASPTVMEGSVCKLSYNGGATDFWLQAGVASNGQRKSIWARTVSGTGTRTVSLVTTCSTTDFSNSH